MNARPIWDDWGNPMNGAALDFEYIGCTEDCPEDCMADHQGME